MRLSVITFALLLAAAPRAAAAPQASLPAVPAGEGRANYVVGPDDVLTVTVFNEAQLSGRYRVENDGHFSYPFLGRIKAGGATVAEVAGTLRTRLSEGYLRNPQVTVDVEQFRSQSVFVIGEVRTPGKYMLSGAVTLIEALAQAGSTTAQAGAELLILHPKDGSRGARAAAPDRNDADVQRVNFHEIESGRLSKNVIIRDGDTIFVPKAERFFVTGFVRTPGSYTLEPNMTVLQAISIAGGVTERGSGRRLKVTRVVNGERKDLDARPTDLVQAGDTITVRQRLL
ncbi:MAG TPA: polysaccharide biosynthesis/export family protein [Vicinamibacterales bacterium]|nr:polysaccharide biosynthesis/export family protein [Vicinamibacterales bacterium]